MYAVIRSGGKQYKVESGQRLEVERVGALDDEVQVQPLLVVDGDSVLATPAQLADAVVKIRVVGDARGPKINGFTYKSKSNQRRHWGHRQHLSLVEVTDISVSKAKSKSKSTKTESATTGEA